MQTSLVRLRNVNLMNEKTIQPSETPILKLLSVAALLTILGVAATTVLAIETLMERWLAIALLAGISALTMRLHPEDETVNPAQTNIILGIQTVMLVILLIVFPQAETLTIIFYILSVEAMLYNPPTIGASWLIGYSIIMAVYTFSQNELGDSLVYLASFAGGLLLFSLVSGALRNARMAQRRSENLLAALTAAHQQLQDYSEKVESLSVHAERNRMAREMHDTIGHRLTVAAVQLEAARKLALSNPEKTASVIVIALQEVREALSELRQTVGRLREQPETDLVLSHALNRLAESFRLSGELTIHLEIPDKELLLPDPHRLAIYRAAQEGLTNVQRHAQATQAWLRLESQPACIILEVEDNGRGLPGSFSLQTANAVPGPNTPSTSYGLRGMYERITQLGGRMELVNRAGGGTCLRVSLPFVQENSHA